MLQVIRLSLARLPCIALPLALACGEAGSNESNETAGGAPSTCAGDESICDEGFTCDDSGDELGCVDIDECSEGADLCDEHAECKNTDGSYKCICEAGFRDDGRGCADIDECAEDSESCVGAAYCVNKSGSFSCAPCPLGYELDGDTCVDIDECANHTHDCDDNANCDNSAGSYGCTCAPGFEGDGEECTDVDECEEDLHDCDDASLCVNETGTFSCEPCPLGYELAGNECNALVPHVLSSTPNQGADDVYPSEFFVDPGFGIREHVNVRLTFDLEMNTSEATLILTDEDELEEPRAIEGTWDVTGHVLSAVILPRQNDSAPALHDETTYHVSFAELESSYGASADPEDSRYPSASLTFTTGTRVGVLNHACIHVLYGPFASATAIATPDSWAPNTDMPHNHYTITLPEAADEYVGYTSYFPTARATYHFYVEDGQNVRLEIASLDFDTLMPGPWKEIEIEVAPPACHAVTPIAQDPVTGEPTLGTPETGITHQYTLNLSDEELYLFRWTSPLDTIQMIVENAGSY